MQLLIEAVEPPIVHHSVGAALLIDDCSEARYVLAARLPHRYTHRGGFNGLSNDS
jgi:hypothetical protein